MRPLYHPASVRAMDAATIASGTAEALLMERAGAAVGRAAVALAGRRYGLKVVALCGKGNNGGDGVAAARWLARHGAAPVVWLSDPDALSGQTAAQLKRWRAQGGRVAGDLASALAQADVALDCLLGTGASGAPRGGVAEAITLLNAAALPVVACDGPSGVDAALGTVPGVAVRARSTVVIGADKVGLHLWPARAWCGQITVADIGLRTDAEPATAQMLSGTDVARLLPAPDPLGDKRTRGVVLVVAGSPGMSGAATLCAQAALAAGAGLVTVATAEAAQPLVAAQVPEALTMGLAEDAAQAAAQVREAAQGVDAVVAGPGLGVSPWARAVVHSLLDSGAAALVVDADGLNVFRDDAAALTAASGTLLALTPHARELARLTRGSAEWDWDNRVSWLSKMAAAHHAVVVAKGPGTLTAAPGGELWLNRSGGPALATAGTGDVLAGLLAAVLAVQPSAPAVAAGVHLHGLAGELAGSARGTRAALARDVIAALPAAWRQIEEAA